MKVVTLNNEFNIIANPKDSESVEEREAEGYYDLSNKEIWISPQSWEKRTILIHELIHNAEDFWGFEISEEANKYIARHLAHILEYNPWLAAPAKEFENILYEYKE
jgi:hypothetical protein